MFNNDLFTEWLDKRSSELMDKLGKGESLSGEEMIILVLKAQTNHFDHLDKEVKDDIYEVKNCLANLDKEAKEDTREIRESISNLAQGVKESIKDLILQMDKRFEQVDKRFEQVEKRFEQVDKRFDRVYRFMQWQTGIFFALFAGIYTPTLISYFRT